MTQSIINFITSLTAESGYGSILPSQENVFNYEISSNAQAYYTYNMNQILTIYNSITALGSGGASVPQAQQLIASLTALNNWATMQYVNSSGTQVAASVNASGVSVASSTASFTDPAGSLSNPNGLPASGNIDPTNTPANTLDSTMNSTMAQALENIDGLLSSVISKYNPPLADFVHDLTGALPSSTAQSSAVAVLNELASQSSIYQFGTLVQSAINTSNGAQIYGNAFSGSQSIQQALSVDFINSGNTLLFAQMTQLNTALNTNQSVLGYLNSLQDLMNQKSPQQFIKQLGQLSSSSALLTNTQYNNYEASTYNTTLGTNSSFGTDTGLSAYENLSSQQGLAQDAFLSNYLTSPPTPTDPNGFVYSAATLIHNLTSLMTAVTDAGGTAGTGQVAPSSQLTQSLQAIINDLNSVSSTGTPITTVQSWVQDIQSGNEGGFQTDLNNAITAAQSFNDVQGQQLSNVMFVFQQFYQSSSSLLTNLNTLINKMADAANA